MRKFDSPKSMTEWNINARHFFFRSTRNSNVNFQQGQFYVRRSLFDVLVHWFDFSPQYANWKTAWKCVRHEQRADFMDDKRLACSWKCDRSKSTDDWVTYIRSIPTSTWINWVFSERTKKNLWKNWKFRTAKIACIRLDIKNRRKKISFETK